MLTGAVTQRRLGAGCTTAPPVWLAEAAAALACAGGCAALACAGGCSAAGLAVLALESAIVRVLCERETTAHAAGVKYLVRAESTLKTNTYKHQQANILKPTSPY